MSDVNLEENLEDLVKQIQTANDKAVFDEILMLQKFIGQPMTDHAPVHVSLSSYSKPLYPKLSFRKQLRRSRGKSAIWINLTKGLTD